MDHLKSNTLMLHLQMSWSMTKPTKWPVHPVKTQISLDIHPVWSVLTVHMKKLPLKRTAKTDQTVGMPRLIRVFAGHTGHFADFIMLQLKSSHAVMLVQNSLKDEKRN